MAWSGELRVPTAVVVHGGGGLRHGSINICIVEQGQLSENTTTVVIVAASMSLEHMVRRQAAAETTARTTSANNYFIYRTIIFTTNIIHVI